jgi:hypothetical protein
MALNILLFGVIWFWLSLAAWGATGHSKSITAGIVLFGACCLLALIVTIVQQLRRP